LLSLIFSCSDCSCLFIARIWLIVCLLWLLVLAVGVICGCGLWVLWLVDVAAVCCSSAVVFLSLLFSLAIFCSGGYFAAVLFRFCGCFVPVVVWFPCCFGCHFGCHGRSVSSVFWLVSWLPRSFCFLGVLVAAYVSLLSPPFPCCRGPFGALAILVCSRGCCRGCLFCHRCAALISIADAARSFVRSRRCLFIPAVVHSVVRLQCSLLG